jgi:hypothetical protein
MEVYGFDQGGLYNAWRQAHGLRPILQVAPPTATTSPAAEATRAPITLPGGSGGGTTPTEASATATAEPETAAPTIEADSSSNSLTGIIIAIVTLLIALSLGGGAFALLRSERATRGQSSQPLSMTRVGAAVFRFVGAATGLLSIMLGGGYFLGIVVGSAIGILPGFGILGVLLVLAVAFPLVRFVLMPVPSLRPLLRWLYPYEGWTGDDDGKFPD